MTLKQTALENTVGKGEIAGKLAFPPFTTVFSTLSKREIVILATFNFSSANAFNLVTSKILVFGKDYVLICSTSLLKTLLEKGKMLIMNNFSFPHSVFYLHGDFYAIFIKLGIILCKLFQFGRL